CVLDKSAEPKANTDSCKLAFIDLIFAQNSFSIGFEAGEQRTVRFHNGTAPLRNFMVTGLQDIDKCRQQLHDISVPLEVFEYIDQGRNPQLYTKECLERALAKNEQVKGKIDTM
ncbi:hypothetical protein CIB84_014357, partial [Bambusicola thoracicus]